MTISERRSSKRIPVKSNVGYFYLPPSSNSPTFHALNLSAFGACIEAPNLFVPGASLAFHWITPDQGVADVRAQVVYSKPVAGTLYHVGVRFNRLAERDQDILTRQIETYGASLQ